MYRINNLGRKVLIMTDEVIRHAPTKNTLDPKTIEHSIIIAEERFIVSALGSKLYQELLDEKNIVVTSSNKSSLEDSSKTGTTLQEGQIVNAADELSSDNKALWDYILWKLIAECVLITAYPEGFVQFGSSGLHHENPPAGPWITSGLTTPDLRSVKWVMDEKMRSRIDPLIDALHTWLCGQKKADSSKFPLYKKECDCDDEVKPLTRRTDIILGIYDDEDGGCCK